VAEAGVSVDDFLTSAGRGLPVTVALKVKSDDPTETVFVRTTEATAASAYKTRAVLLNRLGSMDVGMLDPDRPGLNSMVDDPV
jgi:hypothetical protein